MSQPTVPPPPPPTADTCPVALTLDVTNHERSARFYAALGFETVSSDRPGMIYEIRTLRSARFPAIELRLRAAFGKRPIGSCAGTLLNVTLRTPALTSAIAALTALPDVRWMAGAPPEPDASFAELLDPDGYHLLLTN